MKRIFDFALEQLRWQWEHASNRSEPSGVTCAALKPLGGGPPTVLVIYAWGDGARKLYEVMEANGMAEAGINSKRFPPKPDGN